jgi:hypothetical protein
MKRFIFFILILYFPVLVFSQQTLKKETDKETMEYLRDNLRIENINLHIETGYAYLSKKAPASLYFSLDYYIFGMNIYYVNPDFWTFAAFFGYRWGIPAGELGFMPYVRAGVAQMYDPKHEDFEKYPLTNDGGIPVAFMGQVGLKITGANAPGLFAGISAQINLIDKKYNYGDSMRTAFSISLGYAFR